MSKNQTHGQMGYHYGKAKMTKGAGGGERSRTAAKGAQMPMQRRVMPGDAHAAMKMGKGC